MMQLFSLRDTKAESYAPPVPFRTEAEATRAICAGFNQPGMLNDNPEDFQLFRVGTFDPATGKINPEPPVHITNAIDLFNQKKNAVEATE